MYAYNNVFSHDFFLEDLHSLLIVDACFFFVIAVFFYFKVKLLAISCLTYFVVQYFSIYCVHIKQIIFKYHLFLYLS